MILSGADAGVLDRLDRAQCRRPARRVHRRQGRRGRENRLSSCGALGLVAIGLEARDDLDLILHRAEALEHAGDAIDERGRRGIALEDAEGVARLEPCGEVLAGEHAAVEIVRRDDGALLLPLGDVVVHEDDLHPCLDRLVERRRHGWARRRDGNALDSLSDHVLDRRDLARVVRPALATGVDDLRARGCLVPLLGRVDEREVEVDRELGDEPEFDDSCVVLRRLCARRDCHGEHRRRGHHGHEDRSTQQPTLRHCASFHQVYRLDNEPFDPLMTSPPQPCSSGGSPLR